MPTDSRKTRIEKQYGVRLVRTRGGWGIGAADDPRWIGRNLDEVENFFRRYAETLARAAESLAALNRRRL